MTVVEGELLVPEIVTLDCGEPGCGESFTGPQGGKGSAPMLRGRHRWSVHKIKGDGTRAESGGGRAAGTPAETTLLSVVADAGAGVKGSGAPRADQLGKALGKILASASGSAAGWAVRTDPAIAAALNPEGKPVEQVEHAQAQARLITASLSLSVDAAQQIAAPLGRLLAPTALNQRIGRVVVENTDLGPAVAELLQVGQAWGQFLAVRREHVRELKALRQQLAAQQQAMHAPADPGLPVPPPPAAYAEPEASPLGSGVLATPTYRTQ